MTKDEWYKQLFERLNNSKFRSSFHLKQKDIDYINEKVAVVQWTTLRSRSNDRAGRRDMERIRQHAEDFISKEKLRHI